MLRSSALKAGAASLFALGLAGAALAAPACPDGARPCDRSAARAQHARMNGDPADHAARHLERLKTELKLQPTQEAAWSAFATQALEQAKAARAERDEMDKLGNSATAPDRLAAHISALKRRTATLEASQPAMTALYASLSTEQRAVFDRQGPGARPPRGPGR
ncbi:Spy/CpxP family protein refolding chaperone [Ideonella sp. 4Y11]|uniref:Spy/CpxP family protein refolding chaperone n=1 Tax=Ideonella aquatica TaxID=2824119 RepID=A0A941BLI7_9BURK|nr:Spy/CpxP family protein refolding chaperone [Ideonella aquatica]MBQ0961003.1 Spy/CpxP family protein refolding chaperone [Ideonella aquatica]